MREPKYSHVDSVTGHVIYNGALTITKADHHEMMPRTEAFLPGDERGHLCASSLSPYAVNTSVNVVPQNGNDINHGAWLHTENGERTALMEGASIDSLKTAYVDGKVGDRPNTFTVSDHIIYADGHREQIHFSFINEAYADQALFNEISASLQDTFNEANPSDTLRSDMSAQQYAELMESSDALLPGIETDYAAADYSGLPLSASTSASDMAEIADIDAASVDITAECGIDDEGGL